MRRYAGWVTSITATLLGIVLVEYAGGMTGGQTGHRRYAVLREFPPNTTVLKRSPKATQCSKDPKGTYLLQVDEEGMIKTGNRYKSEHATKILFLGGSTTESLLVNEKSRFPSRVERLLNSQDTRQRYTIRSAAMSGNNSMHSNIALLTKGLAIKPKYVIAMHNINDLTTLLRYGKYHNNSPSRSIAVTPATTDHIDALMKKVAPNITDKILEPIYTGVRKMFNSSEHPASSIPRQLTSGERSNILNEFKTSLSLTVGMARTAGGTPILMTQANRLGEKDSYLECMKDTALLASIGTSEYARLYGDMNETIRQLAQKEGILLVDLAKFIPPDERYIYDAVHLTSEGSAIAARYILDAISRAETGLMPAN